MSYLQDISTIVFLEVEIEEIQKRIHNIETRGIAKAKTQTFRDLFNERQILYKKYANLIIDSNKLSQEEIAEIISSKFSSNKKG
jgi:shikimate kinase